MEFIYARSRIAGMQSAGYQVTLTSLDPSSATLEVNGKTELVETRVLKISGKGSAGLKYDLTLEIASGLGALGQVVREVQDKGFGTDTFHVTQVFHGQK